MVSGFLHLESYRRESPDRVDHPVCLSPLAVRRACLFSIEPAFASPSALAADLAVVDRRANWKVVSHSVNMGGVAARSVSERSPINKSRKFCLKAWVSIPPIGRECENVMRIQSPNSDSGLLGLLRITGPLGVLEMADALEVTPTAIRRRLVRLMGQTAIQREATLHGRGRPRHRYWPTEKGLCMTRSNFTDLAMTRWEEMLENSDPCLHRKTLRQIARELAAVLRSAVD